jgi:hypothetical protein
VLEVTSGRASGLSLPISAAPLLVGSAPECDLRLPADEGVAARHARVWLRDGHLMVHRLSEAGSLGGGEWSSLAPDEELRLGDVVLAFAVTSEVRGMASAPVRT